MIQPIEIKFEIMSPTSLVSRKFRIFLKLHTEDPFLLLLGFIAIYFNVDKRIQFHSSTNIAAVGLDLIWIIEKVIDIDFLSFFVVGIEARSDFEPCPIYY